MAERVVAAMSGGVDSSVAAALLVEQGHDVIGITMRLWTEPRPEGLSGRSQCCGIEDVDDARRVARRLGIPHYTLNMEDAFRRSVVDPFIAEYAAGRTPNPCLDCNTHIKFDRLLERAAALGADRLATGHYARIDRGGPEPRLLRGADPGKDQSYFLYTLSGRAMERTLFPVGGLRKDEVRGAARRHGLAVAEKAESADICFVPGGDYRAVVRSRVADRPGLFLDVEGREVGRHDGIQHFTIGQRRGLGAPAGERRYVTAIDAAANTVTLGPRDALLAGRIAVEDCHWLADPAEAERSAVQLRYRSAALPARVSPDGAGGAIIELDEPAAAVAAGQAAVFYDAKTGERVLGGGTVREVLR